jgi:hypothetical protein
MRAGLLTIAIDRAVRTRLFPVAFDFFPTALIAGSGDAASLLHRSGGLGRASRRSTTTCQLGWGAMWEPLRRRQVGVVVERLWGGSHCGCWDRVHTHSRLTFRMTEAPTGCGSTPNGWQQCCWPTFWRGATAPRPLQAMGRSQGPLLCRVRTAVPGRN